MDIHAASSSTMALAETASAMKSGQVAAEISVAVLKQIQDVQQQQAQALIQMIQQSTAAARGGVDLYA